MNNGSVWRKWDLQVQTRLDNDYKCLGANTLTSTQMQKLTSATRLTETEINSQEKSISPEKYAKLFVHCVGLFTDIKIIAITDHNKGDELDYLIAEAAASPYDLHILPGVEISSNHGIHMLCIFNPSNSWKPTWAEAIDHFLTEIGITGARFNAQRAPLSAQKSSEEILELVHGKGGVSIFAHIGTSNGLFMNSNTANGGTTHSNIYTHKYCQIVQVPHTAQLTVGTVNILNGKDPQYGNKKIAQIKCSDARKLTDIGKQFVWIKADPTLNGLRQIIFESDERVKVQQDSPDNDRNKIYFSDFGIKGSTNFAIPNVTLEFNRGLITIIGGRGSGKSALLETFAFLNEEHLKSDQNGKKKIIEFFRDNEERRDPAPSFMASTTVVDKNNNSTSYQKALSDKDNLSLPFLYLGQEQLSRLSTSDSELTQTICTLIGIGTDEFDSQPLIAEARDILVQIQNQETIREGIVSQYERNGYDRQQDFVDWIKAFIKKLELQQQRLSSTETQTALKEINTKTQRGLKLKELSQEVQNLADDLKDIEINERVKLLNRKVRETYPDSSDDKAIELFDSQPKIQALTSLQAAIQTEMNNLRQAIATKKSELIAKGIKEDVNNLLQASQAVQHQINAAHKSLETYQEVTERLTKLVSRKYQILPSVISLLDGLCKAMTTKFAEFQSSRNDSPAEEKGLFLKTIEGIDVSGEIILDQKKLCNVLLENYIDKRKVGNELTLKQKIAGVRNDGLPNEITPQALVQWVKTDLEKADYFNVNQKEVISYILARWPEFLKVRAVVKLNDKKTDILSIGQRGTLLLKVYLATASARQVLIIDQPEDNLDNNFIMNELVPLIRKVKASRQIIMSTHNANLVVNADAEEVIVANLDPDSLVPYRTGGIENSEINSAIREVLEGGDEAFRQREQRYLSGA